MYGVGLFLEPQGKPLLVRRIRVKIAGYEYSYGDFSIYKSTVFSPNPTNLTLIETIPFAVGQINRNINNFQELVLSQDLILKENEYIFVLAQSSYLRLMIKRYTTAQTGLNKLLYKLDTGGIVTGKQDMYR